MIPLERLTHVGLCVSDLERSLRFYRDLLGFRSVKEIEVEGEPADTLLGLRDVKLRAAYLERDGVTLELLRFARPPAPPPRRRTLHEPGLTHLSFRVADLDATLAAVRAAGERVLDETLLRPPALPPPGPNSVSATRAVSRKGVARSAAPPARGRFKASDSCRVMILAMISPGKGLRFAPRLRVVSREKWMWGMSRYQWLVFFA